MRGTKFLDVFQHERSLWFCIDFSPCGGGNKVIHVRCSIDQGWLSWLGLRIILTFYGSPLNTTYIFSGKLGPWKLLGMRAIYLNLGLRVFPLSSPGFTILGGGLSLRKIVPETSELMVACRSGDTQTVKALFTSRRASPYDVTPENSGPMRVSIL